MNLLKTAAVLSLIVLAGCSRKPAEWRDFEIPEGGFTISMPGKPHRTEERPSPLYKMVIYQSSSDSKHLFAAGTAEDMMAGAAVFRAETAGQDRQKLMLEEGENRILTNLGSEILHREDVSLPGIPGKRVVLRGKDSKWKGNVIDLRFYVKDFQLIQLMAQTSVENPLEDEQIAYFYKSFRFNEAQIPSQPAFQTPSSPAVPASGPGDTLLPGEKVFKLKSGRVFYGKVVFVDTEYYNIQQRDGKLLTIFKEELLPDQN